MASFSYSGYRRHGCLIPQPRCVFVSPPINESTSKRSAGSSQYPFRSHGEHGFYFSPMMGIRVGADRTMKSQWQSVSPSGRSSGFASGSCVRGMLPWSADHGHRCLASWMVLPKRTWLPFVAAPRQKAVTAGRSSCYATNWVDSRSLSRSAGRQCASA